MITDASTVADPGYGDFLMPPREPSNEIPAGRLVALSLDLRRTVGELAAFENSPTVAIRAVLSVVRVLQTATTLESALHAVAPEALEVLRDVGRHLQDGDLVQLQAETAHLERLLFRGLKDLLVISPSVAPRQLAEQFHHPDSSARGEG